MKICALHDGGSGCMYYRVKLPLEELARQGHDVTFISAGDSGPDGPETVTQRDLEGYDVITGQRLNKHEGLTIWRRARTPYSRLAYDTDDDLFTVGPENWNAYHVFGRPDTQDAISHSAQIADLVTVTTPYLGEVMKTETGCENVAVLPNYIPALALDTERPENGRPSVGWQGGASHGLDVGVIVKPVRQFLKRFPGWDLRLQGTDFRPTFKSPGRALFSTWVKIVENPRGFYETLDFDIGLIPLTLQKFDLSKSNVKALEYAARGIPSIATDCEVYRSFIRHGENGFLARHEHEWLHYMSILASDENLRRKMGQQAKEDARDWTIEGNWQKWEAAYSSLFKSVRVY